MKSTIGAQAMEIEPDQPIPDNIIDRLVKEKKAYAQSHAEFVSSFFYDDISDYFLISTKFLNEWKKYSDYNQKNLQSRPSMGIPPQPYNKNLLISDSSGQKRLKPGLMEGQDYEIISTEMMGVFKNYKGDLIDKKAYKLSNGKKIVEVYGLEFKYFFLSQKIIADIDTGLKLAELNILKANISRYLTIKDFKKACIKIYDQMYKKEIAKNCKIWKMDKDMNPKKYHSIIKAAAAPQMRESYKLKNSHGQLFDKEDCLVQDIAITQDDILIIQIKQVGKDWVIKEGDNQDMCEYCRKYQVLSAQCGCKKVKYCSSQCRSKDVPYHRKRCDLADQEQLKEEIAFNFSKYSKNGICGLSNLGNTCFMNSCLQCLSNTKLLTEYFVSKKYVNEINKTNPIGTKGKLTVKYAKMIQGLWCGSEENYSPYVLKNAISDFQPMFSGYSQHDSQELLSFLLDGLHQDLNRVINKPYVEGVDYKGQPDKVFAFESWKNYLLRNKSVIVDLFMGQYKSKVVCPDCKFQSVTFDPFSTVSLPIPQVNKVFIEVYVFYMNYRQTPKKISIDCTEKSIKAWKQQVSKVLSLDPNLLNFYVLSFNGQCQQFTQDDSANRLISISTHERSDIFLVQCSKEEKAQINISTLIYVKFAKIFQDHSGRQQKQTATYKRPFYWKISKLTGKQIYQRIFSFLWKPSLSLFYRVNPNDSNPDVINKHFEKAFQSSTKSPFQVFLMSQLVKVPAKSEIKYEKQELIAFNSSLQELLFDSQGQLKKVQFEVRFKKDLRDQFKKLNTYQDYDKYKKSKQEEDDTEYNLTDCLRQFQKTQKLEVGNQWRCPKCKDYKLAYKSMSLYKTPKVLILHLKRFKQKSTFMKSKLTSLIKFPFELDIDGFVINKSLPEAYFRNQSQNVNVKQSSLYQLYAVSNHYGGLGGGHYTAYCKNNNQWYDFNDSHVHKVKAADVISSAAYMLFYRRMD